MGARSMKLFLSACLLSIAIYPAGFTQTTGKPSHEEPLKIGVSMDSMRGERWQTDVTELRKRAEELGVKALMESAEGDDDLQFRQSQMLLDSGVKALVLFAHDTAKAGRIVDAAHAKHVPVVCYDRLVRDSDVDFYVGFDSYAVGVLQAAAITRLAPKGNYVLLGGSPKDYNAKLVRDGQMKILKPLVDRGDIKIVADAWILEWSQVRTYEQMTQVLESFKGDIAAVLASNDEMAGGAIQALEEHKLAGKVLVSGQDADLAAIIRILNGTQTMTVYKPITNGAKVAAETAVSLARGAAPKGTMSIANGAKDVPAVLFDPVAVTKDNVMQTVIKDGFQDLKTIEESLPKEKWPR